MRKVELVLTSPANPDFAFRRITEFGRYPEFVDEVRSVVVHSNDGETMTSEWDIQFRNGPLRWAEVDYIRPATRSVVFEQTGGDFEVFRGSWRVEPAGDGCRVTFEATFDFGIPSLAGVLEPIADKVLKEAIGIIVHRLLGEATIIGEPATSAAVRARLGRGRTAAAALPV
jgi:ribosome-associated toxin RatA of RatAB toxin-antitoxin module